MNGRVRAGVALFLSLLSLSVQPVAAQTDVIARGLAVQAKARSALAQPTLRVAATKTGMLGQTAGTMLTPTTVTGATYRVRGEVPKTAYDLQLTFSNSYINGASGEVDGPNDITVKPAVEIGSTAYPCRFNGQASITLPPGGEATCTIGGFVIPAGTTIYYRTYISVASGGQWPVSRAAATALGEGANANVSGGSTGTDVAYGTGTMSGNQLQNLFHPKAVAGYTNGERALGYLADSIGVGVNDTTTTDFGLRGPFERAFSNQVAWISNGRSSAAVTDFNNRHRNRMMNFPRLVTSVVNELGSNDIYSGTVTTLAGMQAAYRALWAEFKVRGIPIWQTTITPRTSSTDGWTSLPGQTISNTTYNALRVQTNDWLRANWQAEGLAGLVDFADAVESSRNSGLWRVDLGVLVYTDGIHPVALGNQVLAAAVPVASMP